MLTDTDKWSPSYDEPVEAAVCWGSKLQLHDINKRSIMASAPDEQPDSPALFLTRAGELYLRVCWGRYYMLSDKVSDDVLPFLRKNRAMEVSLLYSERRLDITCSLYHLPEIPELIRKSGSQVTGRQAKSSTPDFKFVMGLLDEVDTPDEEESPTISDIKFDEILSIRLPEVEFEPLTTAQVARALAVDTLWKVDKEHYLARCGGQVVLLGLFDRKGDWLADEDPYMGEPPLWYSEDSHCISPVTTLLELCREVSACISAPVQALMVLGEGCHIINEADMVESWKELNAKVCNISSAIDSQLPMLADCCNATPTAPADNFRPAGYKPLHFDISPSSPAPVACPQAESLCTALNVNAPLAQKGDCSLWYTPGHVYMVYEFGSPGRWLADEEVTGVVSPLWFNETEHIVSPAHRLREKADLLSRVAGVNIHRVLVLNDSAEILNLSDLQQRLKGSGVLIATQQTSPQPGLLSISEAVTACRADDSYLSALTPEELERLSRLFDDFS